MATTDKAVTDTASLQAAVSEIGAVAQAFSDLVKVALGAVIGALSATLQSVLSEKDPITPDANKELKNHTADVKYLKTYPDQEECRLE